MRFLMIYPNQWAIGNKPIGIATLSAVLKSRGHHFKLFDFTPFVLGEGRGYEGVGEMSMEFRPVKNPERLPPRRRLPKSEAFQMLVNEIEEFKPDIIGLSALSDDYPLGLQALRHVRARFSNIPVIVGGLHPTVDPIGVMNESCVDMICIGEGEGTIADLGERFDRREDLSTIPNLWVKTPKGIVQNMVRPLIQDLDSLPYPDWTIYPEVSFYKPFNGYVYKYGDFEMSRGCPYKCSYCINVELQNVYAGKGNYHREKSVKRIIEEICWFKQHYGIEFLKFWDESFLLMSQERLEALTNDYGEKIGLPFAIETTAQSVNPQTAPWLKRFGCATASLGLETGNVDLRRGVLDKNTDNAAYEQAYALLRQYGVRGVSFNMIGLPFERRKDIFESIHLNKHLRTDGQSVSIFYPYKGTPIRKFCEERGFLDEEFEQRLFASTSVDFGTYTRGVGSVLKLCDVNSAELVRLRNFFSWYVFAPYWMWPLIDECGFETELSEKLESPLFLTLQLRRYDELPLEMHWPREASAGATQSVSPAVTAQVVSLRTELPKWVAPLLDACEHEPVLAQHVLPRLQELYVSDEEDVARWTSGNGAARKSEVGEEEQFNRGGRLDAARLAEIRQTMRGLAKEDVHTRLHQPVPVGPSASSTEPRKKTATVRDRV